MAVQFGARAHRLTKGAGKEKILSICVKNGQLHWQRHQQCAVKLAQKSDKYLDTGPTGKLFHFSTYPQFHSSPSTFVATSQSQLQQQSTDRWPDSWQARHMGLKKGCLAHAKMATAA